jgi:predicted secreted protein
MASISGGEIRVLLSTDGGSTYKGFALESDCSFEMNAETREVTSKDDALFRKYVASAKNWTISGSALFGDDDASNWNPDQLYDSIGDIVDIKITQCAAGTVTPATGETKIEGEAVLTQLSASFPDKDSGSFTFALQGSGAWTVGTN